jgi:hypothetical protein
MPCRHLWLLGFSILVALLSENIVAVVVVHLLLHCEFDLLTRVGYVFFMWLGLERFKPVMMMLGRLVDVDD